MNLLSVLWDVSPVIFRLGSMEIRWYGILFCFAFIISYYLLKKLYQKDNISISYLDKLIGYIFFGVFLGARVGHCLFYEFSYYSHNLLEILLPFRISADGWRFTGFHGLASHGAAIGILIAVVLYAKKTKIPAMWLLDRLVIAVCFAGASIRLGNLMNSEIYGSPTSLPWGFIFLRDNSLTPCHPTQLYEAFSYILIGVILYLLATHKTKKLHQGSIFGIFLTSLFGVRFFVEFLKNVQESWESEMLLNMGQILSIPFIILGIFFIVFSHKNDIGKPLNLKLLNQKQTKK
ncbi:MAG: prolipoprotein diacylglyceryl transferase [Bacteroidales bacterium]|nr:prolipoprotein diacylglyceryl transferase [Bacteroidales bacterium]